MNEDVIRGAAGCVQCVSIFRSVPWRSNPARTYGASWFVAEALDTTTAQGRLVFHIFGALAEFERSLMQERTQAGLADARRAGRTGGRPPKLTGDDIEAAKALVANPDIGVTQIAHRLGVSPATLYRYIPAARTANTPGV